MYICICVYVYMYMCIRICVCICVYVCVYVYNNYRELLTVDANECFIGPLYNIY